MRALKCDECGHFAVVVEEPRTYFKEALPKNWLRVFVTNNEYDGVAMTEDRRTSVAQGEFCSFACASRYLATEGKARA